MTTTDEASATWARVLRTVAEVGVDLSDYSDEFVAGFAAGVEEAVERLEGRTVCTYCGHTAGCYCACPSRLGHLTDSQQEEG